MRCPKCYDDVDILYVTPDGIMCEVCLAMLDNIKVEYWNSKELVNIFKEE